MILFFDHKTVPSAEIVAEIKFDDVCLISILTLVQFEELRL
jgi:hypothetical protein